MDPWKRKGHGLLGFHPNHVHYISMLMLHEIATSVCACVWPKITSVCTLSKGFQVFVVICDFHLRHSHYWCLALKLQGINTHQKVCNSSSSFMFKSSPCHAR